MPETREPGEIRETRETGATPATRAPTAAPVRPRGWRGAALLLGTVALLAAGWSGLAAALAGARATDYPAPRVAITVSTPSAHTHINQVVVFTARHLAGTNLTYYWQFGDGTQASGPQARHAYATTGQYQVGLVATDPLGQPTDTTAMVTIFPPPPVATFQWFAGATSTFEIDFSADSSDGSATFSWTFGDGTMGLGQQLVHFFAHTGTFVVRLTVTDAFGQTTSATQRVRVPVSLPFAYFTETPQAGAPQAILFDASASQGPVASYQWDFGDGTNAFVRAPLERHDYAEPGTYPVTLTVNDGTGRTATYSQTITVT